MARVHYQNNVYLARMNWLIAAAAPARAVIYAGVRYKGAFSVPMNFRGSTDVGKF